MKKVAEQNDKFRKNHPFVKDGLKGRFVLTRGVSSLEDQDRNNLIKLVIDFDDFGEDDDPFEEHDFGAMTYKGKRYFWKIDYYDYHYRYGSACPEDPLRTARVLTIMKADEY